MAKAKILIVEDETLIAHSMKQALLHFGYHVTSVVATGEEAIRKAEEERPDLVLMDIFLKGKIDGIEAAKEISSRFNIPIIYLSAYSDENTMQRMETTVYHSFISKPYNNMQLNRAVSAVLQKDNSEAFNCPE